MPMLDARRAERLSLALDIAYSIHDPENPFKGSAKTTNISGGGLQLVLDRTVAEHTPCSISLKLPNEAEPLEFTGRIVRCQARAQTHEMEVGIEFDPPQGYNERTFNRYSTFIARELLQKYLT